MKNEKIKILMELLRDKFLKIIDEFCKENKGESILIPFSAMIGSITGILSLMDENNKFDKEIMKYTEKFLFETSDLMDKIRPR